MQLSLPIMTNLSHHDYSITHRIASKTLSGQLPPYSTFTPRNKQINNFKHPVQSFLTVLSANRNTHQEPTTAAASTQNKSPLASPLPATATEPYSAREQNENVIASPRARQGILYDHILSKVPEV